MGNSENLDLRQHHIVGTLTKTNIYPFWRKMPLLFILNYSYQKKLNTMSNTVKNVQAHKDFKSKNQ